MAAAHLSSPVVGQFETSSNLAEVLAQPCSSVSVSFLDAIRKDHNGDRW